jgi:hypothetical protein
MASLTEIKSPTPREDRWLGYFERLLAGLGIGVGDNTARIRSEESDDTLVKSVELFVGSCNLEPTVV